MIVAIAALWWYFHGRGTTHADKQELDADAVAAEMPDEIIVDLADDATPDQIAALERDVGIHLTLDSDQAASAELFVAGSIRRAKTRCSRSSPSAPRSRSPSPTR